ncbi:MAG: putative manganese transporter [Bacteroidales bacterium]|nr:putative manganese transporter [Bacteroidales bacterium]
MEMIPEILMDSLLGAILITGLVIIMMIMIESLNIESKGRFFEGLGRSRVGGVLTGALLGVLPGCLGGFATVSLYTHRMLSFGALVAMMIASAGDEAFVMLAMIPKDAIWIFALLFGIAIAAGIVTDLVFKKESPMHCGEHYAVHSEDTDEPGPAGKRRHLGWKRAVLFAGVAVFLAALVSGHLEHGGEDTAEIGAAGFNLLSEDWMNVTFAVLSLGVLAMLVLASDHFVEEHIWRHIILKHLPRVFAWTFGVLVFISLMLDMFDISGWISGNTAAMILLATLVGIIPESGPHLIFVTLYASGIVPLPVLLASCISQDGHASLPLLAESKTGFLKAKLINCAVALAVGFGAMLIL